MSEEHGKSARTDQELIEAARGGDRQAFGELWARHSNAGRRLARSITQTFDADDLVSEAYLKIFAAVTAGGGPAGAFRPYLFVTIRNLAVTWSRRRREQTLEEAEDVPDPRATDAAVLAALDSGLTLRAFKTLPERWQEVLWFTEVDALTPAEIAERLGLRANSVAALAYRAREGLRQAWIQAHIDTAAAGSEHQWVLSRVGKNARGALSARNAARFSAHLTDCPACTVIADEAVDASRRFTSVLLPLAVGITGTAGLGAFIGSGVFGTGGGAAAAPRADGRRTGGPQRAPWLISAAVLAVALIGSGVGYAITVPQHGPEGDRVRSASDPAPTASSSATPSPLPTVPKRTATPKPERSSVPVAPATSLPSSPTTSRSTSAPEPASNPNTDSEPQGPVIFSVDTGNDVLFPVVTGTGTPTAIVTIRIGSGSTTATVDADGSWRTTPIRVTAGTYTVTATADGVTAPSETVTVWAPLVSLSSTAQRVAVTVHGRPAATYVVQSDAGDDVQVTADGNGTARTTLQQRSRPITVSAYATSGNRTGPVTSIHAN